MNTLKIFIENQAEELLQESDLAVLTGGAGENEVAKDVNALADCSANTKRDGYLTDNGEIVWENNSAEKRISSRFKNKSCNICRIQPICNGGCSQKNLLCGGKDYCTLGFDEAEKDQIIKDRFVALLHSKRINEILNK